MFHNLLQNAFVIQFGLTVRDDARRHQKLNRSRATKRNSAGINAAAIGTTQDLSNRNAVSAEGFSDALGLLKTTGRKVYFLRAVPGREASYPFSDSIAETCQR